MKTWHGYCNKCGVACEGKSDSWFRCQPCRAASPQKGRNQPPCTPEMAAKIVALLMAGSNRSQCIVPRRGALGVVRWVRRVNGGR